MSDLEEAGKRLAAVTAHAEGLAIMGSAELHSAVERGPAAAADLLAYHGRLRAANDQMAAARAAVDQLRAAAGLEPLPRFVYVAPDFGPMPADTDPQDMRWAWHLLLGSLNGQDIDSAQKALLHLDGWRPADQPRQ